MTAHLRKTFLAGAFAAIPVVVTVVVVLYVEHLTRVLTRPIFGREVPGVGVLIALALIYVVGLFVSSLIGRWFIRLGDRLLHRLPLLRELYVAWKQISFSPGGGEGIYGRVVLIPDGPPGSPRVLAFSTGEPIAPTSPLVACFVPNVPNPVTGRVVFVPAGEVTITTLTAEEAFKILLSSGNYVPAELVANPIQR